MPLFQHTFEGATPSKKNRDAINKGSRDWKRKNPDKVKKSASKYRLKNASKIKQKYMDNRLKISAKGKKYYQENKEVIRAKSLAYYKKNRQKILIQNLCGRYNITEDEYFKLVQRHDGRCGICNAHHNTLCVDHCHVTGEIRGLLCDGCNKGIGFLKDDTDLLESAKKYLMSWPIS